MEKPLKKREFNGRTVWMNDPIEIEGIKQRRDIAFNIALERLLETNGNIETVMQTGEAFGRGLFEDLIKEKPEEWTMEAWLISIVKNIFNPLGNVFTFSKISKDEVKSILTRCTLQENTDESLVASLFTYGFMRSLLKSAFPKGELILGNTTDSEDCYVNEFVFKTSALYKDKFERERIKSSFSITKKL